MKHTPTPWIDDNARIACSETGTSIAHCNEYPFSAAANAAFIVKAVNCHDELVAALEKIAGVNDVDGNSSECDFHEDCQDVARKALAKAKGESQ